MQLHTLAPGGVWLLAAAAALLVHTAPATVPLLVWNLVAACTGAPLLPRSALPTVPLRIFAGSRSRAVACPAQAGTMMQMVLTCTASAFLMTLGLVTLSECVHVEPSRGGASTRAWLRQLACTWPVSSDHHAHVRHLGLAAMQRV